MVKCESKASYTYMGFHVSAFHGRLGNGADLIILFMELEESFGPRAIQVNTRVSL